MLEVGRDGVVVVHGDVGRAGLHIGDVVNITGPVDKPVADILARLQVDHRASVTCKRPLARFGYRATSAAGDGEVVLRYLFKVSSYGVVTVHGDRG